MRRLFNIYILVLLALGVACQRVDLPENQPAELPIGAIGSKATITFSTADVTGPETRGTLSPVDPVIEARKDVKTLHLIVFDQNGMLVEVCEASKFGDSDHVDPETGVVHKGGRHYTVTLTVTDEPRIIHYVANCPVDQVVYGHETSIIGNMFVDRNNSEGYKTEYETSYWARIEVPHILVKEEKVVQDGNEKIVVSLVDDIKDKFSHVPLLRNYAEIVVTDKTDDKFYFEGFTVYNLLNRGTIAPYNSNKQEFQSFTYFDDKTQQITNYSYPQISALGYEGHALTSATLITDFIRYDKDDVPEGKNVGDIKFYGSNEPFYVYERKVSVMTDEEEKWRESPPHIIIKGRYNHGQPVNSTTGELFYYKMDLVYTTKDANGNEDEIKYYNILRNFMYQFNLTAVHDVGYRTLEEAVAGAAGNNISGSSSTSKLTNVSDNEGRLWVSYTDITLVTGEDVVFRYKYVPNYYNSTKADYQKVDNSKVRFENIVGDVITGIDIKSTDVTTGTWKGYREVTVSVNSPDNNIIRQQILSLKTDNANLNRQIRYTLRQKLKMEVECTPKVSNAIMQPVQVDIKLPLGMTDDMFPLELNMETKDRTLSPDADKNKEPIPVTAGTSIIDTDDRRGQLSYYYTVIIPTYEVYKALPDDGNMKVYSTYWLTNKADNASTFYVDNKYFEQGSDEWKNYEHEFSNVSCEPSALGVGKDVTIKFSMANGAINTPVTISLKGMTYNGATEFTYTPTQQNVTLTTGLETTTDIDPVSFTLDADNYNVYGPVVGDRLTYKFDGQFVGVTNLEPEADVKVDFKFYISDDALAALKELYGDVDVPMYVTLDRMHPADNKQLVYSQIRAEGDRYIYRIKEAGWQTINLLTSSAENGVCAVTLQADYFDTQTVTIKQFDVDAMFLQWNDTKNSNSGLNSSDMDYVIVGQTIRYYVGILADSKPTTVTIDGKNATELKDYNVVSQPEGAKASRTVWYIDWSNNTKGSYDMKVSMTINGKTTNVIVDRVSVDLILGNSTTSPTMDGKTIYVMQNNNYTSTYCTSANDNLSASTSLNYSSLFTFDNGKIKSIARERDQYCNGTNGSISFKNDGTTYTFNNGIISYTSRWYGTTTTYYIRQTDTDSISLGTDNSNNTWKFYLIKKTLQ